MIVAETALLLEDRLGGIAITAALYNSLRYCIAEVAEFTFCVFSSWAILRYKQEVQMEEVLWGMIGCGDVTERKSGPGFQQVAHSRLVAVASRSAENAQAYASRHNVPRWYQNGSELIADPQVNAIYIATPPDSHAEYTLLAAQAGKPVYVEKPMARTYAECLAMNQACQEAGVPLFVAYYRRCLPGFLKVKELVESGAVGAVRFISIHLIYGPRPGDEDADNLPWRVRPEISGGGHFYDLASHQLDYLDYLFDPIVSTAAQTANQAGLYPPEDIVTAAWRHASGVLGSAVWCFSAAPAEQTDRAVIVGSHGRITFSFFDHSPVCLETERGVETFPFPRRDPIQLPLIQLVVDALRGKGSAPSTGESAARTNRIMEQMIQQGAAAERGENFM
jgi:predicted dehydrogenase